MTQVFFKEKLTLFTYRENKNLFTRNMMIPLTLYSFLIIVPSISCQSLEDLIKQVFTESPQSSTPPNLSPHSNIEPNDNNNAGCKCVPFYLCDNGKINKNGDEIIDIRMKDDRICKGYLDICCGDDKIQVESVIPKAPVTEFGQCGIRNSNGIEFQIAGSTKNEAEFGEFPWTVALFKRGDDSYQCGGSLIHPKVVLTTAHCIKNRHIGKIRAGEWDTQITVEPYPHQDIEVESKVIHPHFEHSGLKNDIALLFLKSEVKPAPHIGLVCLPPQDTVVEPNTRCFATGWGKNVFGKEGTYQVILKKINLPAVHRRDCQRILRKTRLGESFELHKSFICAGGEIGKDTCEGDGGSPLVCPIPGVEGKYYQTGMVAWGIGCGTEVPGVYVNVALFKNWIDLQMTLHNLDTAHY